LNGKKRCRVAAGYEGDVSRTIKGQITFTAEVHINAVASDADDEGSLGTQRVVRSRFHHVRDRIVEEQPATFLDTDVFGQQLYLVEHSRLPSLRVVHHDPVRRGGDGAEERRRQRMPIKPDHTVQRLIQYTFKFPGSSPDQSVLPGPEFVEGL